MSTPRPGPAVTPIDAAAAAPRWCVPLVELLGDQEPDDDAAGDWIIRDLVPRGEPSIWAGPPKAGKTWAVMDVAMSIALGSPWLGGAFENTMGAPALVLVLAFEDARRRLRKRIWELARGRGTSPNDPALAAHLKVTQAPLRIPDGRDLAAFTAELQRFRPAAVLVDNLTRVMVGDQNAISAVAQFTAAWSRICLDTGASVVMVHHTSKSDASKGRDPFEMVRGSGDLVAAARNIVVVRPLTVPGAGEVAEYHVRGNLELRRDAFAVGFERSVGDDGRAAVRLIDRGPPDLLRSAARAQAASKASEERTTRSRTETEERRLLALSIIERDGAVSSRTLAEAARISDRLAATVLAGMQTSHILVRAGQRGYVLADQQGAR